MTQPLAATISGAGSGFDGVAGGSDDDGVCEGVCGYEDAGSSIATAWKSWASSSTELDGRDGASVLASSAESDDSANSTV